MNYHTNGGTGDNSPNANSIKINTIGLAYRGPGAPRGILPVTLEVFMTLMRRARAPILSALRDLLMLYMRFETFYF